MLSTTCHCGDVRIEIPDPPAKATSCNCSLCWRLGTIWGYYDLDTVRIEGHPEKTVGYVQGDRMLRTVRCRRCGCTTHWEPMDPLKDRRMGVNLRNFTPEAMASVEVRLFDGADTWSFIEWAERSR